MQSTLFEPSNLPMIQPDGALSRAVFVEPLMGMVVVGLVGIAAFLMMRQRGKLWWGLACFGMAGVVVAGLSVTSQMVVTEREALSAKARDLVQAVAVGDEVSMGSLLAEHVRVETRFAGADGREKVVALAALRVPRLVESHSVPEVHADLPGPRVGRTMVKVRASSSAMPTTSSWWMIHWERADESSGDWVAVFIEPIWIQGVSNPGG